MNIINKIFVCVFSATLCFGDYYYSYGKKIELSLIDSNKVSRNSKTPNELYYQKGIHKVGVYGGILVQFDKNANRVNILKDLKLQKVRAINDSLWLVKTENIASTLVISNELYKRKDVVYAHPDFLKKYQNRTFNPVKDPLFENSWHLKKNDLKKNDPALNIREIFKITEAQTSQIGIIDDGLDVIHEDLHENIASYVDLNNPNEKPSLYLFPEEKHGTQMSGVIIGAKNNKGSVGIAPKAKLFFAKHNNERRRYLKVSEFLRGFEVLEKTDVCVISNSWGTYDVDEALEKYINYMANESRGGKGRVIVFASGNNSFDLDDKKYNDESEIGSVLGIATIDREFRELAYYSSYGSNVDLATIGDDIQTTFPNNIYGFVSGTSPSAAIVSSVAGLICSVSPNLNASEIKEILKSSSTTSVYHENRSYPVLNALNAVNMALDMQSMDDVKLQMLHSPIKTIVGEFVYNDFDNTPDHLDWVLIKEGKYYRLMGEASSLDNKFGFKQIDAINHEIKPSFYLVNRFGLDTFASEHWVIVNKSSASVYLMDIEKTKISYKPLSIRGKAYSNNTVIFR